MLKQKKTWLALLLIPQYLVVTLLAHFPEFIDHYYSNGFYQFISQIFRYTLGWFPFSFGDLLYVFTIIYSIRWFYKNKKRIRKDTKNWVIDILASASVFYFAFHLFWGLNYYRLPLHENLKLNSDYTTEQLIFVTEKLIEKSNQVHLKITKNDTLKIQMPYTKKALLNLAPAGFENLKELFPNLEYHPKSIKKSLFSYPLTYMGFSGYLNPFTNEAHIDNLIPSYKFPTTASHEIAHQLGYAAENEANFIGCLASINHKNVYFNYAGYTAALRFCLNEVYNRNPCLFEDMIADVNQGILKNYKEVELFWNVHQNPMEPFFKLFYNNFLKANKQTKGIESYSYVVALLTNYFDEKGL